MAEVKAALEISSLAVLGWVNEPCSSRQLLYGFAGNSDVCKRSVASTSWAFLFLTQHSLDESNLILTGEHTLPKMGRVFAPLQGLVSR